MNNGDSLYVDRHFYLKGEKMDKIWEETLARLDFLEKRMNFIERVIEKSIDERIKELKAEESESSQ